MRKCTRDSKDLERRCISRGVVIKPYQALDASVARHREPVYSATIDPSNPRAQERFPPIQADPTAEAVQVIGKIIRQAAASHRRSAASPKRPDSEAAQHPRQQQISEDS